MPIVYRATNRTNGKCYIGVTIQSLHGRRLGHFSEARTSASKRPFMAAIRKYGEDAFEWEVLEEHKSEAEALAAEVRLIAETKPEYNVAVGGRGIPSLSHPEAVKVALRASHTPERRAAFSAKRTGYKHRPDTVEKLRAAGLVAKDEWAKRSHLGPEALMRGVICLTDGEQYPSAAAAARAYGVDTGALVQVCQGKRSSRGEGNLLMPMVLARLHGRTVNRN